MELRREGVFSFATSEGGIRLWTLSLSPSGGGSKQQLFCSCCFCFVCCFGFFFVLFFFCFCFCFLVFGFIFVLFVFFFVLFLFCFLFVLFCVVLFLDYSKAIISYHIKLYSNIMKHQTTNIHIKHYMILRTRRKGQKIWSEHAPVKVMFSSQNKNQLHNVHYKLTTTHNTYP